MAKQKKETTMTEQAPVTENVSSVAADYPAMMTVRRAVKYLQNVHEVNVSEQSLRGALTTFEGFKAEGAVTHETIEDTDISLTKINMFALDAYANQRKTYTRMPVQNGVRKYVVRLTPAQYEEWSSKLADAGIKLDIAHVKKDAAPAATNDSDQPIGSDGNDGYTNSDTTNSATTTDLFAE